jgi:hypothetical protein
MAETVTVTVNDVLDGHVGLDLECMDRIYWNRLRAESAGERAGGVAYGRATGRAGAAAIGVAQEFAPVFLATKKGAGTAVWFSFTKANRRVTCYYFPLWDDDFGPALVKVCAYFPYPMKIWVNGHEWAKRQATKAGIGLTELSNGFATCSDSVGLQAICDRLGPGTTLAS